MVRFKSGTSKLSLFSEFLLIFFCTTTLPKSIPKLKNDFPVPEKSPSAIWRPCRYAKRTVHDYSCKLNKEEKYFNNQTISFRKMFFVLFFIFSVEILYTTAIRLKHNRIQARITAFYKYIILNFWDVINYYNIQIQKNKKHIYNARNLLYLYNTHHNFFTILRFVR